MRNALRLCALAALILPGLAQAATPQVGVQQKLRRGLFTETDLGAYFDTAKGITSNAQAYLQLGVGYDITRHLSLAVQFGLGASSGVCLQDVDNSGTCGVVDPSTGLLQIDPNTGKKQVLPDNFSNSFYQLDARYRVKVYRRLDFVPGVVVGYQKLDPAPAVSTTGKSVSGGVMVGADLSLEYATHMDHFFVAADFVPRFVQGPNLLSFAIFPRVKYTF